MGDAQVTVVIPTKDRPHLLPVTLRSVLSQQGVDLRVLVVDDGSAVPVAAGDHRVRVLRSPRPCGVSAARNRALAEVDTPWTAFLDDDDLWGPHKLQRQLHAVSATGHRWACSATVTFAGGTVLDLADVPPGDDLSAALLRGNVLPGSASSVLARTDLVRTVGGFDEALLSMEDWDLWIRLAQASPIARVPAVDVAQRVHPASRGHDLSAQPAALAAMQDKYAGRRPPLHVVPDPSFLEYWARMEYGAGHWNAGLRRTAALVLRHRHPVALRTPLRAALPEPLQARARARRAQARARNRPDLDWSWLQAYLVAG